MPHDLMNRLGEWLGLAQLAAALAIPLFLIWYYRRFTLELLRFATRYLGLTAVLAVLYLMVYGLLGSGLGIPYLFWHDDFWVRSSSSAGATLLLAVVGVVAFYLDPYPWATGRKTAEFLRADEQIKDRVAARYSRRHAVPDGVELQWWDYLVFGVNAIVDPVALTPVQSWLEPDEANAQRLQRFLRTARGPFLILLLAPALLPAVFSEVPRAAPTGKLGLERLNFGVPPTYDVSRDFRGYLLGLAAWLLGIQVGVLVIKAFIRSSTLLHAGRLLAKVGVGLGRSRAMAGVRGALGRIARVFGAGAPGGAAPEPDPRCPLAEGGACPGAGCPQGEPTARHSSPHGCAARGQIRVEAMIFALLFLSTYAVFGIVRHLRVSEVLPRYPLFGLPLFDLPPAFAICAVLAVLAMGYAAIAYLPRTWKVPVVLLLVAWFGYANNKPFKNRFENMSYDTQDLVRLRDRVVDAYDVEPKKRAEESNPKLAPMHLISDVAALEAWKLNSADGGKDIDDQGRPKLVLVVVSGGATRSAYWTAVVLDQLERTLGPSFGRRVRVVSGASGGMLGAACYVTYRRDVAAGLSTDRKGARGPSPGIEPAPLLPNWIREDLPTRSMEPLAWEIATSEIWKAAWPGTLRDDRGVILEKDWSVLRYPLVDLAKLEAAGKVPSLIFSPMIVEDGRRLLISNLELGRDGSGWASSPVVEAAGFQVNQDEFDQPAEHDGTAHRRYSLSSLEYFRVFREAAHHNLLLSTAVRMSASFPFVSPAVNLPTIPPRRVVDAGYYDNYGIQVATSWIQRNHRWLARHTSGVLLVQIRDSSSVLDRNYVDDAPPGLLESASRGFQFFTSPIDAVAKARYTTASFRNDSDVAALNAFSWEFRDKDGNAEKPKRPESFFTTVIFENSARVSLDPEDFWGELTALDEGRPTKGDVREVSMSWYLARAEMAATAAAIPGDPPPRQPGKPDWSDGKQRRRIMDKLNGDVSALPPGPERAIRLKRLDQLYNYERLVNLKTWWSRKPR